MVKMLKFYNYILQFIASVVKKKVRKFERGNTSNSKLSNRDSSEDTRPELNLRIKFQQLISILHIFISIL